MKKNQVIAGALLTAVTLLVGITVLDNAMLVFRLLVGLVLGYALARGSFGFAGCVNRACRFGSTKLIRSLMFLFVITAVMTAVLIFGGVVPVEKLWVRPINLGLLVGGFLFGAGMALASCCATGALADFALSPTRVLIVMLFFGIGGFITLPISNGKPEWISKSWVTTANHNGVFLPDLFGGSNTGLVLAVIVTVVLALIVAYISTLVEKNLMRKGQYTEVKVEQAHKEVVVTEMPEKLLSVEGYQYFLGNPWSSKISAAVIAAAFVAMLAVTKAGWGASGIYALWFGKLLLTLGVSPEAIAQFTNTTVEGTLTAGPFMSVLTNPISVQNMAIILGAFIAVLTMGRFTPTFKVNGKELFTYAAGGLLLGFGARFANGCNVGSLYTPIANLSLSGWIFLVVMLLGGYLGNKVYKAYLK